MRIENHMLAILLLERCMRASRGFVKQSWMVLLASLPERKGFHSNSEEVILQVSIICRLSYLNSLIASNQFLLKVLSVSANVL